MIQPSRPLRFCPKCGIPVTKVTNTPETPEAQPEPTVRPKHGTLAEKLVQALNDEIEYVKKEGGSRFYTLRNGERVGQVVGRLVYRFDFEGERIEADVPVVLQLGESKEKIEAEVVSIVGQEITLASKSSLPETIPKAKMFADPLFILEKLRDRILSPPKNFKSTLSDKLFAEEPPRLGRATIRTSQNLNEFQKSAVERSLGSEVFFIWGPPGTGKTTTISAIIAHAFTDGKTILITSNTNVAVDNAISKAEESIRHDPGYEPGDIVRVGIPQAYVPDTVLPEQIAKKKQRLIDEEIQELEKAIKQGHDQLELLRENIRILDEYGRLTTREQSESERLHQSKVQLDNANLQVGDLRSKLERARSMSSIERTLRRVNVEQIAIELNRMSTERQTAQDEFSYIERSWRHVRAILPPIERKATEIHGNKSEFTERLNEILADSAKKKARITHLENTKKNIEKEIIAKARVVGTTLAKTWLRAEIFNRNFDLVVIDEASMATLPMLYFSAGIANQHVLIVGDFKQIPPIVLANTENTKQWLRRDIFHVAKVTNLESSTGLCEMLRIQYRMNPDISKIISTHVYNGLLTDHESVKRGPNVDKPPGAGYSLILLDTSTLNPWCMTRDETHSRINLIHAELAVYMAEEAIRNGFNSIGIITPYRAQARLLARRIEDENLRKKVEVATVHRFQGREKEVVIFDVSDGKPYDPSRLISTRRDEERQSERLLNVAVSRAQDKLIIIANLHYLEKELDKDELLLRVIYDCQKNGIHLLGEQFLNFPKGPIASAKPQDGIPTYGAEDFYPVFESDLTNAREDIVIVSAFVTARRVRKLEEILRASIERGVEVRILTKPPETQFDNAEMKQSAIEGIRILKNLGARIEFNPKTHEKMCIIDNQIVWHGSLNILSQYKSSESMIRFVGENTARQLLADVGLRVENVLKPESFDGLRDGMRGITATGKILRMEPVQFRRKSDGSTLRFAHAVLEAEGRQCDLTLWGAETDLVKQGAEIRVINGYTTAYNGVVSLQSGKFGKIEVLEIRERNPDTDLENEEAPDKAIRPKGVCRHCGKTIQFGSVTEHEAKCASSRS
jgi:superfamily I DNA and/or RNA helicase